MKIIHLSLIVFLIFFMRSVTYGQFSPDKKLLIPSASQALNLLVEAVDLDQDGDMDVLCSDGINVSWFENLGNNTYASTQSIGTSNGIIYRFALTDIGLDGDQDIIFGEYSTDKISWYENLGGGLFAEKQVISTEVNGPRYTYVVDIDNDGSLDIVCMSDIEDEISWFRNLGNSVFSPQVVLSTEVYGLKYISPGDIDNDGLIDLAVAKSYTDTVVGWFKNNGNGELSTTLYPIKVGNQNINGLLVTDLDNDNTNDIIYGIDASSDTLMYRINSGSGTFSAEDTVTTLITNLRAMYSADLDNDGIVEVLSVSSGDQKFAAYHKTLNGEFLPQEVLLITSQATSLSIGDLNGDGFQDMLTAASKTSFHLNLGSGTFASPVHIRTTILNPENTFCIDLDNDDRKDILVTSTGNDEILWFKNQGAGVFSLPTVLAENVMGSAGIFATDCDGDGDNDVFSASREDNKISWFENLGNGNFGPQQVLVNNATYTHVVKAADIDNDGDDDIVFGWCSSTGEVKWMENLGAGLFGPAQLITSSCSISISIIDIDNDGWKDVVSSGGPLIWVKNIGNGVFDGGHVIPTSSGTTEKYLATGDVDLDGDVDIILSQFFASGTDNIVCFKNQGDGTFDPEYVITTAVSRPSDVELADIDNDGDLDLLRSDEWNSSRVAWHENLGNHTWGAQSIISLDLYSASSITIEDIDGDSDLDIIGTGCCGVNNDNHKVNWFENYLNDPYDLQGTVYYDVNQNGLQDNGEIGFDQLAMQTTPNGPYSYTFANGNYMINFQNVNSVNYEVQPVLDENWIITSDSLSYHVNTYEVAAYADTFDFGIYPIAIYDSIESYLTGGFPRCNDTIPFWINVKNSGTTFPSGIIHITLDDSLTYVSASVLPDSVIGQNIYWSYTNLNLYSNYNIQLQVETPGFLPIDSILSSFLETTVIESNINVFTSADTLNHAVVCAYDPNDKIVTPMGVDTPGYIPVSTEQLEYVVRFQNTGTDTAQLVVIKDRLDYDIDWSSVDVLASSHYVETSVSAYGEITFRFPDIQLPYSNANFILSNGFVRFRVKLKPGLSVGTQILNKAEIYFDFNPAVITNTTLNTLYECGYQVEIPYVSEQCEDQLLSFDGMLPSTDFSWEINGGESEFGEAFYWYTDSAGTFTLNLHSDHALCHLDTVFNIVVTETPVHVLPNLWLCPGDSVSVFGSFVSENGIYSDTLQTLNGCDSIVMQTLQQYPLIPETQLLENYFCQGDSLMVFGVYRTEPGVYQHIYQSVNGCDSIVSASILHYTVEQISTLPPVYICEGGETLIFGSVRTIPGTYSDTLQNMYGCDSILSQSLLVFNSPTIEFDELSSDTMCVDDGVMTLPIASPMNGEYSGDGVENDQFDPFVAGVGAHYVYYNVIDSNGCNLIDSLELTVESCLSVSEFGNMELSIYPNPVNDIMYIKTSSKGNTTLFVEIFDVSGRVVYSKINWMEKQLLLLDLSGFSKGTYRVRISDSIHGETLLNENLVIN